MKTLKKILSFVQQHVNRWLLRKTPVKKRRRIPSRLPERWNNDALLAYSKRIRQHMQDSPATFPPPPLPLLTVIDEYQEALVKAQATKSALALTMLREARQKLLWQLKAVVSALF